MAEVHKLIIEDNINLVDSMETTTSPRMILNPNKDIVLKIVDRIFMCEGKCPCQPKDPVIDTRCPCFDFTNKGICHCHLFVKGDNAQ